MESRNEIVLFEIKDKAICLPVPIDVEWTELLFGWLSGQNDFLHYQKAENRCHYSYVRLKYNIRNS